jgi:hypothetical protein
MYYLATVSSVVPVVVGLVVLGVAVWYFFLRSKNTPNSSGDGSGNHP